MLEEFNMPFVPIDNFEESKEEQKLAQLVDDMKHQEESK